MACAAESHASDFTRTMGSAFYLNSNDSHVILFFHTLWCVYEYILLHNR